MVVGMARAVFLIDTHHIKNFTTLGELCKTFLVYKFFILLDLVNADSRFCIITF